MDKPFVSIVCAAFAAHFSLASYAAVPVEESTEENRLDAPITQTLTQEPVRRLPESTRRASNLDIPPTIEPDTQPVTIEPTAAEVADPGRASQNNPAVGGSLSMLFRQMQILQQEVQELRGLVEQQDHQVKRLQREQKEQYLDLDRRIVTFSADGLPDAALAGTLGIDEGNPPGAAEGPVTLEARTEREAYRFAFDGMRAQRFDESLAAFQRLIEDYPNGQFTPNAFYWIGEIFLVGKQDAELARQSFMQVVNLYPDHQKAPDAMYKLGVVYNTLGDSEAAERFLDRVQREHPSSSAAGLASQYVAEM